MKLAIMQPYFFPYIGYFQLLNAVDKFIIYDNVEYTKKGWINRNRLVFNNKIESFSINLIKDSDYLTIKEREISKVYFEKEMPKTLRKIEHYYSKAPYYNEVFPIIKKTFEYAEKNLFNYIYYSIIQIINYLDINTEIIISSKISINQHLKKEEKVFEICNYLKSYIYLNPIGGTSIYSKVEFIKKGITLFFIKTKEIVYKQNSEIFIPSLSIIDVLMYNSKEETKCILQEYELI